MIRMTTYKSDGQVYKIGNYKNRKTAKAAKDKQDLAYGCYLRAEAIDLKTNTIVYIF